MRSSEAGTAYLVKNTVIVTDLASITNAAGTTWNTVAIGTANTATNLALAGLDDGTYELYTTDAAGNLSAKATNTVVVDSTAPTISSILLTSATGIQNSRLNAGDVVTATVRMSEAVTVTGTPSLALTIGTSTVSATYDSSTSTSTELKFTYKILANQTDANGISIGPNALTLGTATIRDAAGNTATITSTSVADNTDYLVDTSPPDATLVSTGNLLTTAVALVKSSETGTAYLVKNSVTVTDLASITGAADANWNSVAITTADSDTEMSLTGLDNGSYHLYTVDSAGNLSRQSATGVVVAAPEIPIPGGGKLINPLQADGNWYYYWDANGDGIANDLVNYASVQQVQAELDIIKPGAYQIATIGDVTPKKANSNTRTGFGANADYDDLLAIWDAYNDFEQPGSTYMKFTTPGNVYGWQERPYWAKTVGETTIRSYVSNTGEVVTQVDQNNLYDVAIRVL